MKIDLAKAYDKVNWLYIKLVLLQMGMNLQTVNYILGCVSLDSFALSINGSPSKKINSSRRFK
jgi:hypothetical protein